MTQDGAATDDNAVAGEVRPPAEVGVVAKERQRWIETAQVFPDIAADQHACGADGEHVAVTVVLPVVELTRFKPRLAPAATIESRADLEERALVVPASQLRADDRRRGHLIGEFQQRL